MTMETIFLKDVLPAIQLWTLAVIACLSLLWCYMWKFKKKNPEIFEPDTTAENKQMRQRKNDLRGKYYKMIVFSFAIMFLWIAGVVVILSPYMQARQSGMVLGVVLFIAFCVLADVWRKPKD